MGVKKPSFSGYVTKANLECEDGRVITPAAFKHQDGMKVPLVYQHNHTDIDQVLGHVILSHKNDGIWGDAFLNEETPQGKNTGHLVRHGDLDKFSIWAKNLIEQGKKVMRGNIKEVSLVLAGANPGAIITEHALAHSGYDVDEDVVYVGGEITHDDSEDEEKDEKEEKDENNSDAELKHADGEDDDEGPTIGEVLDTLTDEQELAVNALIEELITEAVAATQAAAEEEAAAKHDALNDQEEGNMGTRNVFDSSSATGEKQMPQLKHDDVKALFKTAMDKGVSSLRQFIREGGGAELMHAGDYGVDNVEVLFPDAQTIMRTPTWVDRRQEWVKTFISGVGKSPFARIKTMYADITADEARAKGYIKGNQKTEEVFAVFKRTTGPAMIYKKQKLDRQDIIDITSFDVVAWIKAEMRGKLDEELARAGLFGDGRPIMVGADLNPDKIQEPLGNAGDGIRSIVNDNELYTDKIGVPLPANPANTDWNVLLDSMTVNRETYLGSGNITAFMPYGIVAKLLTIRDSFGHRIYRNLTELAGDMDVNQIVRVPTSVWPADMLAILVDLADYNFGTDMGGQVTLFDFFDIDFNQYKYLMETYLSGALVLPYSAQVYMKIAVGGSAVTPTEPGFVDNTDGTGVITIPTSAGVEYRIGGQPQPDGLVINTTGPVTVTAVANPGYPALTGTQSWTFTPTEV